MSSRWFNFEKCYFKQSFDIRIMLLPLTIVIEHYRSTIEWRGGGAGTFREKSETERPIGVLFSTLINCQPCPRCFS